MKPLKIVIISRVIFPKIAPRSMRATELAKEFARQGHDVSLYGALGSYDYSMFQQKTKVKVKSIGNLMFAKINSDDTFSFNFFDKVLKKIFGRLLEFPDIELSKNTYYILKKESNIDLLITVAIPFPIHWGAALYKALCRNKFKHTTWVADCGDPYMGNPFHKKPFYFKYIEKWFCRKVDYITVPIEEAKEAYYQEFKGKIKVIPQGFSFEDVNIKDFEGNDVPTFIYAGVFYSDIRNPSAFLDFLSKVDKDFKFIVYTKSKSILERYVNVLNGKLIIRDYIPRTDLLKVMSQADFVVNFENNSSLQSPSKLIDYALSQRPILSLNSNKKLNEEIILEFLEGNYENKMEIPDIQKYNIKNIASDFINLVK